MKSPEMVRTKMLIELLGAGDTQELTLYELGALIVVAGKEAGFDVRTEYEQLLQIPERGTESWAAFHAVLRTDANHPQLDRAHRLSYSVLVEQFTCVYVDRECKQRIGEISPQ